MRTEPDQLLPPEMYYMNSIFANEDSDYESSWNFVPEELPPRNMSDIGSSSSDRDYQQMAEHQPSSSFFHLQNGLRDTAVFREKTEFSDVLLSIKAPHPQMSCVSFGSTRPISPTPFNHPSQTQLFSPNYNATYSQLEAQTHPSNYHPQHPNFGMSVNVSMNMTMGYLNPEHQHHHHHHQWPHHQIQNPAQSSPSPSSSSGHLNTYSNSNYHHQAQYASYSLATPDPGVEPFRAQWISSNASLASHSQSTSNGVKPTLSSCVFGSKKTFQPKMSSTLGYSTNTIEGSKDLQNSRAKLNLCRFCGKSYARPSTLKTHQRTHSGEKPFRCTSCSKSFSQAANLTAHSRTHTGDKPFRCMICNRRFSQSSSVTTHMRTHSGERPYRCRLCRKAFSDSSTLTKHLRIHSGEKPYSCTICFLRFSQSGNLNRHMRVHNSLS